MTTIPKQPRVSWSWINEYAGGTAGAVVDLKKQEIEWFEGEGCGCSDHTTLQNMTEFVAKGANIILPAAVEAAMQAELGAYLANLAAMDQ